MSLLFKPLHPLVVLAGAGVLFGGIGSASAQTAPDIKPAVGYTVAGNPVFVAAADVNGDGKADLVTANSVGNTVGVLVNKGDGTFRDAAMFGSGGATPTSVVVGDFNGDGKADLAVSNSGGTTVGILTGKGDGTFNDASTFDVGGNAGFVAGGDLDGDSKMDLAVLRKNTNQVATYLSNGDGTFTFEAEAATGNGPVQAVVSDCTSDGIADIGVTAADGTIGVYQGAGNGAFTTSKVLTLNAFITNLSGIASANFNGAGGNDLVVTRLGAPGLIPNVGIGLDYDPNTQKLGKVKTANAGDTPASVAVGDLNGDGIIDLLFANQASNNVTFLIGNGDGTFGAGANLPPLASLGGGLVSIATGNFGNGKVSFAAAEPSNNRVDVYVNGTVTGGGGGEFKPYADIDFLSAYFEPSNLLQTKGIISGFPCGQTDTEPCGPNNNEYFHPGAPLTFGDAASWVSKAFSKTVDPGATPNAAITRGQLAKMISDAAGFTDAPPAQPRFVDVPTSNPYFTEVERLNAHGAAYGYSCGASTEPCIDNQQGLYFRPAVAATRGQGILLIRKAMTTDPYQPSDFQKQVTAPGNINLDFHPDVPLKLQLNVSSTGVVTINTLDLFVGFDLVLPLGYSLTSEPLAFELQSSAAPAGDQEVCIDVPELAKQLAVSKRLRVFHGEGGILQDRTDDAQTNAELLCAKVSSFSPFVVLVASGNAHGDVNGDGQVDVGDAVYTLQSIVGISTLDANQTYAADVDSSGAVDVADAVAMLRVVVQLDPPFQP